MLPAARTAFLGLFVMLFAVTWSNDSGLRAAPVRAPAATRVPHDPREHNSPTPFREKMADRSEHSSLLHPGRVTPR